MMRKRKPKNGEQEKKPCPMAAYGYKRYSRVCRECLWGLATSNCPLMSPEEIRQEWSTPKKMKPLAWMVEPIE